MVGDELIAVLYNIVCEAGKVVIRLSWCHANVEQKNEAVSI